MIDMWWCYNTNEFTISYYTLCKYYVITVLIIMIVPCYFHNTTILFPVVETTLQLELLQERHARSEQRLRELTGASEETEQKLKQRVEALQSQLSATRYTVAILLSWILQCRYVVNILERSRDLMHIIVLCCVVSCETIYSSFYNKVVFILCRCYYYTITIP